MATTKIRGNTQIMQNTIDLGRLNSDFLNGSDWNITNGNEDATITGVKNPVNAQDVATKAYVDGVAAGLDPKESVAFTTKANLTSYSATGGTNSTGSFTSTDLTSGTLYDFGGHAVTVGDRILVKNQTDTKQNGIYVVLTTGASGTLERAEDQDGTPSNEVSSGNFTFVENGSTYGNTGWVTTGDGLLTLNTDNVDWVQFSGAGTYTADESTLTLTGTVFSVKALGIDTAELAGTSVTAAKLGSDVAGTGLSGGNGSAIAIATDGVQDTHIDWGTGAGQVSAADMPIADAGGIITATDVEGALAENRLAIDAIEDNTITGGNGISTSGTVGADNLNISADVDGSTLTNTGGTGAQLAVAADGINETHIDWGSGSDQVDATSVPLDTGGSWAGAATNVQDALEELEGNQLKFSTIATDFGANVLADTIDDTLTLQSSSGIVRISGDAASDTIDFDIATDSINDTHIDWGTGANQVSAVDVPIADSGTLFSTDNVESALQEVMTDVNAIEDNGISGGNGITASGSIGADTLTVSADVDDSTLTNTGGSGAQLAVAADGIKDTHIDWGTGANQVSATDMPIADAGTLFAVDTVEAALQEVMTDVNAIEDNGIGVGNGLSTSGTIGADNLNVSLDIDGSLSLAEGTGAQLGIANDGVGEEHINWGTGAGQVSATDMPIADSGTYFTTDTVEAALQDLAAGAVGIGFTEVWSETPSLDVNAETATLAQTPQSGTLRVYLNGLRCRITDDYTLATNVVTFVAPGLSTGDVVVVDYKY